MNCRMAIMWETMRYHHDSQSKIVIALRYVDITQSPKETSEHHHERTFQLWLVAQDWHTQFQKLLTHQKEYVKALNNWLKLNLIPIESSLKEKVSSPPRIQNPPIQGLLHSWHHHLDKLPDEFARTAILNFSGVINTIWQQQEEELKLKQKCEDTQKELERKRRQFQDWYEKYMKRMAQDESNEVGTEDNTQKDLLGEKQFMVESLEKKLENDVEEYHRQCNQVREKSLATLKIHLPEVFRAISDFADACSKMYRNLSPISKPHNSSQSSS
jgi:Skp family chaperone for outer membrane proteins